MNPSILVAVILFITYIASFVEKLKDWDGTIAYYNDHFNKTIIQKYLRPSIILVLILELLCILILIAGIIYNLTIGDIRHLEAAFYLSFVILTILLIGQRIAQDYQGSTSLIVYLILNITGISLL
ncbi:MAG: hypothetical protein ACPGR7_10565 [Flavobacteriaceae bacterium]